MSIPLLSLQTGLSGLGTTVLLTNPTGVIYAISGIDLTLDNLTPTAAGIIMFGGILESLTGSAFPFCQFRYTTNGVAGTTLLSAKLITLNIPDFIMLPRGGNIQLTVTAFSNVSGSPIMAINLYGLALP